MSAGERRPLIAHVVFRFDTGGLENGIVNLVNGLPPGDFRHAIIALTEVTEFRRRLCNDDVSVHALGKRPGQDPAAYHRLFGLLRQLRPDVVHTRNIGTMDCQAIAALAGVRVRIHGEHGWDTHDPDGNSRKYKLLRSILNPMIHRFVAVSRDLERWLVERVGISARKVTRICNGVDTQRFQPRPAASASLSTLIVVGSVTRFESIKDPLNLVRAFLEARRRLTDRGLDLRLLMIGDGPLREPALKMLHAGGAVAAATLPGDQPEVTTWLHGMDLYALGSKREGISNTVLEAMACGLPVIASATGGNLELVAPDCTGRLVPPEDSAALAKAIIDYASDPELRRTHGESSRRRAEEEFSLTGMITAYRDLYHSLLAPQRQAA